MSSPQASGYSEAGASHLRRALKGFVARSTSPNEDIDWNQYTLRQRGRMLYMSSPVAASAINTNRTKIIGTGLMLKSTIDREALGISAEAAKDWQRKAEREFCLWAEKKQNCDALGVNNFYGLQQLAVKAWLTSGDVFGLVKRYDKTPLNPYTLRIHMIEADRVSTPDQFIGARIGVTDGRNPDTGNEIHDGVEVDAQGQIVAYHICNAYPFQLRTDQVKWTRVEAYGKRTGMPNILHITDTERPDQYRGVTYLAPVIESLLNISRFTQSELMAALIQSFFTAWIVTETDTSDNPLNQVGYGDADEKIPDEPVSNLDTEYQMGPGTVTHLKPGEKIEFGNPNIPTAGFDVFLKTICRSIGAALEIPYDVLLKEFNASYSASRAALMEAWEAFRMRRKWITDAFCQPIYELWLSEAVSSGRIKAPGFFTDPALRAAWCGARWIGPVQGQLDPTKEVKADILAVEYGFKTHEQVTTEMGSGDWTENVEQLGVEKKLMKAACGTDQISEPDTTVRDEPENNDEEEDTDAESSH